MRQGLTNELLSILSVAAWGIVHAISCVGIGQGPTRNAASIEGGRFLPLFDLKKTIEPVSVDAFWIDRHAVTNRAFNRFLSQSPGWLPENADPSFVDENYLKGFDESVASGSRADFPAVNVSWFAAKAYCVWVGGRLPTTFECEFVALADERTKDARKEARAREKILAWYARPNSQSALAPAQSGQASVYGTYNLHGLIWEWTDDFNRFFATVDSRGDAEKTKDLFCGSAALNATDREDYPAFMRYAYRTSLMARSTQPLLGFRCAYSE